MESKKAYLGDGVYAEFDGYMTTMTTEASIIYLEPPVVEALLLFLKSAGHPDVAERLSPPTPDDQEGHLSPEEEAADWRGQHPSYPD